MRLLVDTNLFLEVLLTQARSDESRTVLENRAGHELFVCDFAVHSIGLLLFRRRQHEVFRKFLQDVIGDAGVAVISLTAQELDSLVEVAARFNVDFDDAYLYRIAIKHGLRIMSYDADLDRTAEGRLLPAEVL